MNPKTSAYERITELVSLLSDYDFEPTIRRISRMEMVGRMVGRVMCQIRFTRLAPSMEAAS